MSDALVVVGETREEFYQNLLPQIRSLIEDEPNLIANLANVSAAIHATFNFHWTGFYLMDGDLVLGPFQGPSACTRIPITRGVCGAAARERRTIIVPDVAQFPGHIACSSMSRSEIVVPLVVKETVRFVLDVDSVHHGDFTDVDQKYLEQIMQILAEHHPE